ncbi:Bro-N domain-containing protein [Pantoea agglomerans]|uniref:BRO-N domain-containing protein n=1 Tax=Pantoea TaxID=53335 RepID=UPI00177D39B0|nr:Bro-N domain-containing protein [Pantoea agglomerans]MBD8115958.1 Bro-N domain-containing protein [Pantoea agglomerans]
MSTSIINHVFESHTVRVVSLNGDHWFIAKDVALSLEYKDTKKAIALHCEDDEVNSWGGVLPPQVQRRTYTVINDSGVYSLIMGSKQAAAKRFKKWVTSVVLPSLSEHGGYSVGQETLSPEMQEIINVQHKATALATACMSGVVKSHFINKEDREKIFKVLMTVAHTCVTLDSLWSFERDAAGALARVGMDHHVKAIPLNMAKAQDDKWIHAKKNSLQVQKHNAEGNGWG